MFKMCGLVPFFKCGTQYFELKFGGTKTKIYFCETCIHSFEFMTR